MTLKMKVIGYWVTTTLIALETLAGGVTDLMHGRTDLFSGPRVVDVVTSLGYRCMCSRSSGSGRYREP